MKKLCLILMSCLLLIISVACGKKDGNKVEEIKKQGKLTLAVSPDYPPYEFIVSEQGKIKVVGADIYLAQKIADKLGVELEIQQLAFDSILPAVTSGRSDIAISGINPNEKRREAVDFSDIYYTNESVFLVTKDGSDIKDDKDLMTKKIGVQKGATQEKFALEELKLSENNVQSLTDVPSLLQDLTNKKIDALLIPNDVAAIALSKNKDIKLSSFIVDKNPEAEGMAIAVKKGDNKELLAAINEVIKELKENNDFPKQLEKYSQLVKE